MYKQSDIYNKKNLPFLKKRNHKLFTLIYIFLFMLFTTSQASKNRDESSNNFARFLAGLPVSENSNFARLSKNSSYETHKKFMNKFWSKMEHEVIDKISKWKSKNIPDEYNRYTIFYPLSGADFINMYAMYPDSTEYLMVAMEKSGTAPELWNLSENKILHGLNSIRRVIRHYGYNNYFATKIMTKEMANINLTGTLPVVLVFMSRLNLKIEKIENIRITNEGSIVSLEPKEFQKINPKMGSTGYRIYFNDERNSLKKSKVLTYLQLRLSNDTVSPKSSAGKALLSFGKSKTILKSAVYLLQMKDFCDVKKYIINNSKMIIQDDSGIAYKDFDKNLWTIKLYGKYLPQPVEGCIFSKQFDLEAEYKKQNNDLPFNFGYGSIWGKNRSNLTIAIKKKKRVSMPVFHYTRYSRFQWYSFNMPVY